jgi:hypothetical protein
MTAASPPQGAAQGFGLVREGVASVPAAPVCTPASGGCGQWNGPYLLPIDPDDWSEIAHAAVLPPPGGVMPPSNDPTVLFWCRRGLPCFTPQPLTYQVFLWRPGRDVTTTHAIDVDATDLLTERDLFCGGQTFDAFGRLVFIGGTNRKAKCEDPNQIDAWGHKAVYLFDNVYYDPPLSVPAFVRLADMFDARWYATGMVDDQGRVIVLGHEGFPDPVAGERFETGTITGSSLAWDPVHTVYGVQSLTSCDTNNVQDLKDYTRAIQLARSPGHIMRVHKQPLFLRENQCPTDPEKDRWLPGPVWTPPIGEDPHRSYNVVHIVDARGGTDESLVEVVYHIGGAATEFYFCNPSINASTAVAKMVNPRPNADPLGPNPWIAAPSLFRERVEANTVVTLDGSLVTLGGVGKDAAGTLTARLTVERFRPPEIFTTGNTTSWTQLAPLSEPREYHGTAVLLPPGGAIATAGGNDSCTADFDPSDPDQDPDPGRHSVEMYNPWYFFSGPRPQITFIETHTPQLNDQVTLRVSIQGNQTGEFRVALLRPSVNTHAYDSNQRYIMLPATPWTILAGDEKEFDVRMPWNHFIAPPGYYMLTVVDSLGRPSHIEWIRLP